MEILESNFLDYARGIPFDRFIKLMRRVLAAQQVLSIDRVKLIEFYLGLKKLFEDIDINNDKMLEWSEFTQYMIDIVVAAKKAQTALKERRESQSSSRRKPQRIRRREDPAKRVLYERVRLLLAALQQRAGLPRAYHQAVLFAPEQSLANLVSEQPFGPHV